MSAKRHSSFSSRTKGGSALPEFLLRIRRFLGVVFVVSAFGTHLS